jgi:hypothetical protein
LALIAPSIFTFSASFSPFSLTITETLNYHKSAHSMQAKLLINLMIKIVIGISTVYCLLSLVDRPELETRSIVSSHEGSSRVREPSFESFHLFGGEESPRLRRPCCIASADWPNWRPCLIS